ncbi:hypothetical protein CFOL_v3_04037 [Cephalotus follicularis]|uniref:IQ domain-containing protein IQM2-like n=1 Tax=Cephalotus follicularis TaxID=3775 RepID=A0A1Q3AXQ6_CEPFO|nr:hypothetical protein CFOL_v3_04037 [Cephalotus follicularis]
MGISFSCPFAIYSDVENGLESVIVKSICFGDDEVKTPMRSISFNSRNLEPTILKSLGSGKMIIEGSVSLKGRDLEKMLSTKFTCLEKENNLSTTPISRKSMEMDNQSPKPDRLMDVIRPLPILDPTNPKHEAAIKLQKVYKSFRTRRKLADCAVLVEQSWWKLLDFAELKRSSISFFDMEKHETAISRWSRARTRAAKVGKGLSKNDKAQKLALQHWLEAIDPRHRYGHNLHFYYVKWLHSQSRQPFFYWLDIGEGKEVNLVEKCSRAKLQQQCIKYLGPMERKAYEVVVENGMFLNSKTGELLNTIEEHADAKWIFVLSTSKTLYVGKKKKGAFQHSSFLAGGATTAAGRVVIERGILKAVWPHSGHYRPTEENFKDFVSFLKENNVDLTDVKMTPVDGEEDSLSKQRSRNHIRSNSSEDDLAETLTGLETEEANGEELIQEEMDSVKEAGSATLEKTTSRGLCDLNRKLTNLEIPKKGELLERLERDNSAIETSCSSLVGTSLVDRYESAEEKPASEQDHMDPKQNLFDEEQEGNRILRRINSQKGMKSYQLGNQLSCKWTTGAGPRIGCVRDYPSELQVRALEQVNLSPTSAVQPRSYFSSRTTGKLSPKVSGQTCCGENLETAMSLSVLEKGNFFQRNVFSTLHTGIQ